MTCRAHAGIDSSALLHGACLRSVLAGGLLLWSVTALALDSWPALVIPKALATFDIGEQMTANGLTMRLRGFTSSAPPAQIATLFRQSLGQPLAEDTLGSKLVLGRAQGEHYVTVQLESAGSGTRGVIAVTRLSEAIDNRDAVRRGEQHLLSRLPAGSRLVSRTGSVNGKSQADYIVLTNTHSPDLNSKYVKNMLDADGFALEREALQDDRAYRGLITRERKTLFFMGPGGEAVAVIFRNDSGKTVIVISTIRFTDYTK